MDPITAAVLAVAPSLASDLVTDTVKSAYAGLKEIIRRKWGATSPMAQAVESVEAKPDSKARAAVLEEEVANVGAKDDQDVLAAVQQLVDALKSAGMGGQDVANINVSISGGTAQGVIGSHNVSVGTMSFGEAPKSG